MMQLPVAFSWIGPILGEGAVAAILLTIAGWLARVWLKERLAASIRAETEVQLARVNAAIRAGESHLNSIRSTALDALMRHQAALNQRRLEAVDQLWKSANSLYGAALAAKTIQVLDVAETAKHVHNPAVQELLAAFSQQEASITRSIEGSIGATASRPYVTPMAWALYSAFSMAILFPILQLQTLKNGLDPTKYLKGASAIEAVKVVMPEMASHLDKFGSAAFATLLPILMDRLMDELKGTVAGHESDQETVNRAKRVAELSHSFEIERRSVLPEGPAA